MDLATDIPPILKFGVGTGWSSLNLFRVCICGGGGGSGKECGIQINQC